MGSRTFAAAFPRYDWTPPDYALLGWTFDPRLAAAATILPTAGAVRLARIKLPSAATITNIHILVTTAGATLTSGQNFAALWTDAGVRLAQTTDQTTAWQSTGYKTMALATPQAVTGGMVVVGLWSNGTTLPTLARTTALNAFVPNLGLASGFAYSSADTGLTTTAPATLGAESAASTAYWFGVS